MDAVLGDYGRVVHSPSDRQAIFPGVNFTCSGSIQSWIFGAQWIGSTASFTELQIWRSSGDGSYIKVGSTTIMTEENTTELYYYPLSSPLPFQAGDILGYYQPNPQASWHYFLRRMGKVNFGITIFLPVQPVSLWSVNLLIVIADIKCSLT